MPHEFAQHADMGDLRLETHPVESRWEWAVIETRSGVKLGIGTSDSLDRAKSDAREAAKKHRPQTSEARWQQIAWGESE